MIEQERQVYDFERRVEDYYKSHAVYQEPRPYLQWYLYLSHELAFYSTVIGREPISTGMIDGYKMALMHALRLSHTHAQPSSSFRPPKVVHVRRLVAARDYLLECLNYNWAVTAWVFYRRGWARAEIVNEHTIRIDRSPRELSYDVLDRIVAELSGEERVRGFISKPAATDAARAFHERVQQLADKSSNVAGIAFRLGAPLIRQLLPVYYDLLKPSFQIPQEWSFRGVSIESFRRYWAAMQVICSAQMTAVLAAMRSSPRTSSSLYSIVSIEENLLNEFLSQVTEIPPMEMETILQIDSLNHDLPKSDPALQPLVRLRPGLISFAPFLFVQNRHERNLIQLVARNYENEFSQIRISLEDTQLVQISENLSPVPFVLRERIRIPNQPALPDVDLAIWSSDEKLLLLVETKWTIGPADAQEIVERSEKVERKAIDQIRRLLGFASEHPEALWAAIFPSQPLPVEYSVRGCAVIRGFVGSDHNFEPNVPVLEEAVFTTKLNTCRSLRSFWEWAQMRKYMPEEERDFEVESFEHRLGPVKLLWRGYSLKLEYKSLGEYLSDR